MTATPLHRSNADLQRLRFDTGREPPVAINTPDGVQRATQPVVPRSLSFRFTLALVAAASGTLALPNAEPAPPAPAQARVVIAYVPPRAVSDPDPASALIVAAPSPHFEFDRGARLGIAEARHAATLLRRELTIIEIPLDAPGSISEALDTANVSVLITPSLSEPRLWARIGGWAFRPGRAIVTSEASSTCGMAVFRTSPPAQIRARAAAQAGDSIPFGPELEVVGTVMTRKSVGLWHHQLQRFGAAQLNARYMQRYQRPMTSRAWEGWMAVKVAWESALRARDGDAVSAISSGTFDGHKGTPLRFGERDRVLRQPLVIVADTGDALRDSGLNPLASQPSVLVREIAWPSDAAPGDTTAATPPPCR